MQTFLPDPDFEYSAHILDNKRLAGQRKEGIQLVHANEWHVMAGTPALIAKKLKKLEDGEPPKRGWGNHPAARMWAGRTPALLEYLKAIDREWIRRGYKSTIVWPDIFETHGPSVMPSWLGDDAFHASHRSNLLRKLPEHYEQFGWQEPPDLEYIWPGPCTNLVVANAPSPTLSQDHP